MATETFTARQDLEARIEMLDEAIAYCVEEGEDATAQRELKARYEAQAAALVGNGRVTTYEGSEARSLTARPAGGSKAGNQFGTFQVHYASPKQQAFIKRLLEGRDLTSLRDSSVLDLARLQEQVAAGTVNKKAASEIIDRLMALPPKAPVATATPAAPATSNRRPNRYAAKCITCTGPVAAEAGYLAKDANGKWAAEHVTCPPVAAAPVAPFQPEVAMYRLADGTLIRAYYGRQSGQILAKKVIQVSETEWDLEYLGKADRFVTAADHRLTLDEAKAWGRLTGSCCVCAAHLDDPDSVKNGIGPVCGRKF